MITDVRTVLLTGPCTEDPWLTPFKQRRSAAFIELHTSGGYVGVGETYLGYFFPEVVPLVVDYVKPILLNAETLDIETLVRRMRTCLAYWGRVGVGAAVIAGIEAALWDLHGKQEGVPVHVLLGGAKHASLPAYATGGPSPWPVEALLEKVDFYLGLGFRAFKVASGYLDPQSRGELAVRSVSEAAELEASKVRTLRQHVGPSVGILLDGHMGHRESADRWSALTAEQVLKALAPYDVLMFEEPLPYDDLDGYARLASSSPIRVAGGEQLSSAAEFKPFADRQAFAVAQPDAAWLSMTDFLSVAGMFGSVAPHAWGAGGAVLQNLHAAFACANTLIVELPPAAGPLHTEIWGDAVQLRDGDVLAPQMPGLGTQLSEAVKERYPFVAGVEEFSSVPGKVMRS